MSLGTAAILQPEKLNEQEDYLEDVVEEVKQDGDDDEANNDDEEEIFVEGEQLTDEQLQKLRNESFSMVVCLWKTTTLYRYLGRMYFFWSLLLPLYISLVFFSYGVLKNFFLFNFSLLVMFENLVKCFSFYCR